MLENKLIAKHSAFMLVTKLCDQIANLEAYFGVR